MDNGRVPELTDDHVAQFQKKMDPGLPQAEPAVTEAMATKRLPEATLATARMLSDRIRAGQQQLGAIDIERSKLDAQASTIRMRVMTDIGEHDAVLSQGAAALGVNLQEPGWKLDFSTGVFTR